MWKRTLSGFLMICLIAAAMSSALAREIGVVSSLEVASEARCASHADSRMAMPASPGEVMDATAAWQQVDCCDDNSLCGLHCDCNHEGSSSSLIASGTTLAWQELVTAPSPGAASAADSRAIAPHDRPPIVA